MMTQAFYTGISGLQNFSEGINVISDNIANVDTVGFRGYNAEFASLFEEEMNTDTGVDNHANSVGYGVRLQGTSMIESNGALILSDRSTDLALLGDGWFGIEGGGDPVYTRDGTFGFDANSDLVSGDGYYVLGTLGGNISADNVLTTALDEVNLGSVSSQEKLRFPKTLTYPAEATTEAQFMANVGVGEEPVSVSAGVIDASGVKNQLKLTFTKSATQNSLGTEWDVTATTTSADGLITYDSQTGSVSFDESGSLVSTTLTSIDNNGTQVAIDLGTGYSGIVSIDVPVVPGSSSTNGTLSGELTGYSINKDAEVIASFSNGLQSSVGKIAVYHFQNNQGLERLSGSRFQQTDNSGQAIFFKDANGQNIAGADVVNYKLESSNYELSSGLTELIVLQRAYDASSKIVTTADQMMQKALQMDA
jgi:flagellar hook protein FlgE